MNNIQDVLLGGYKVSELQLIKAAIQKDANKFISEHLPTYLNNMEVLLDENEEVHEDKEAQLKLINETEAIGDAVNLIAGISGVTFYVPFSTDWDDEGLVCQLENAEHLEWDNISSLFNTVESLEYDSRNWHESRC